MSIYFRDGMQFAIVVSALIILMAGLFFRNILGRNREYDLKENESYWVTVIIWLVIPLGGTLPYLFTGVLDSFTDAVFESYSGFTTTGSSVLANPENLPPSMLTYRAITQWAGGLGLMLLVVALLRKLTQGAFRLYEAEFSGTQQRKLHPRLAKSVTRMWTIYSALTAAMAVILAIQGTPVVDSFCLACSTVSTGGFLTSGEGLAILNNGALATVAVFMILSPCAGATGLTTRRCASTLSCTLPQWWSAHWRSPLPTTALSPLCNTASSTSPPPCPPVASTSRDPQTGHSW